MKKLILITLISLPALTACVGKGYPGEPQNIDSCNPGHVISKDCENKRL